MHAMNFTVEDVSRIARDAVRERSSMIKVVGVVLGGAGESDYFPIVHYYRGRAREGLNSEGFSESYRTYLSIRGSSSEDPLVQQARRRAGL
jgi:CTP-dependent riboflavin kinase